MAATQDQDSPTDAETPTDPDAPRGRPDPGVPVAEHDDPPDQDPETEESPGAAIVRDEPPPEPNEPG
jgi:hypothetical protein